MVDKKTKPLILKIEDAEREIASTINNIVRDYDLPFYFLEPIIDTVHKQIIVERNNEIETLKLHYETDSKKKDLPSEKSEEDKV